MKRIITILLSVLVSVAVMGQRAPENLRKIEHFKNHKDIINHKGIEANKSSVGEKHPRYHFKTSQSGILKSTKAIKQQLDSLIYEEWDENTSQLAFGYKQEFKYDAIGNVIWESYFDWDEITGDWVEEGQYVYSYDSRENMKLLTGYKKDQITEDWVFNYKEEYDYDLNRNVISEAKYNRNSEAEEWVGRDKWEYAYDSNGNMTFTGDYIWDNEAKKWVSNWKYEYTCDTNKNITLDSSYVWWVEISKWVLRYKTEYSYNAKEEVTLRCRYEWDQENSKWDYYYKDECYYDAQGNMTSEVDFNWNEDAGDWFFWYKYTSSFDTYGNIISDTGYKWNIGKGWVESFNEEYTYDANGNMTSSFNKDWDEGVLGEQSKDKITYNLNYGLSDLLLPPNLEFFEFNWTKNMPVEYVYSAFEAGVWFESKKRTYYYTELELTGTSKISEKGIKVFPNPASEFIVFDIDINSSTATVEMFDIQGKKVLSRNLSDSKQVPIHHLAKGLYLYRLNANGKLYNGKIVVE